MQSLFHCVCCAVYNSQFPYEWRIVCLYAINSIHTNRLFMKEAVRPLVIGVLLVSVQGHLQTVNHYFNSVLHARFNSSKNDPRSIQNDTVPHKTNCMYHKFYVVCVLGVVTHSETGTQGHRYVERCTDHGAACMRPFTTDPKCRWDIVAKARPGTHFLPVDIVYRQCQPMNS